MSAPTLKDVAEHAHVSRATVSRVLNNNPNVASDLRDRVLDAIQTLGYRPNRAARRLRGSTSDVLGLIISDIENPFFISVVRGVEDAAYQQQMSVVLCNSDEDSTKQAMYLRVMQAENVAGLIISPTHVNESAELAELSAAGMPIVLLDRFTKRFDADAVLVDNVGGASTAVKHLIDIGYTRIATIAGSPQLTTGQERLEGYRKALESAGIPFERALVRSGDFKIESGYRLMRDLLTTASPPEAVFVANNLMTLGSLRAAHELGVRIPHDVAIIGFDDMPWSGQLCPPLTAVAQPTYELGQEAVRLLLRRRADPGAFYHTVVLQPRLVVRESCGAVLRQERK
ncbi:MAG TPA: LacI family DNA-binding transcriptional regulator [Aggregatilinea sp.]|jgi:DNA-binding LacI/PurR family transcriptional regulator|uniref:LacI family DNA-binding transcriptional regulator n=1 Tax=Aggregatilinea sp. TaxID=2806333 RepID=UPI002C554FFA|nr:LacI family DNA-binding transcriptional regulator [Aggregatilinea sp.]HML21607.1 LacI family DNA-binding transcriptional regulator [Aggregatilinea sp.]